MPIPSKNRSEMIGRNLRSVTPPIDYPVENGGFEEIQSSPSSKNMSKNIKNSSRKNAFAGVGSDSSNERYDDCGLYKMFHNTNCWSYGRIKLPI